MKSTMFVDEGPYKNNRVIRQLEVLQEHYNEKIAAHEDQGARLKQGRWMVEQALVYLKRDEAARQYRRARAQTEFPDAVKAATWADCDGMCESCGKRVEPFTPPDADLHQNYDHIIPRECGGMGTIDNCQLLHVMCHREKPRCRNGRHPHTDYRSPARRERMALEAIKQSFRYAPPADQVAQLGLFMGLSDDPFEEGIC